MRAPRGHARLGCAAAARARERARWVKAPPPRPRPDLTARVRAAQSAQPCTPALADFTLTRAAGYVDACVVLARPHHDT
ncbi:hypothetical protein C8R45DRAFT_1095360 [Mycena sanguinolenta]|nr:hypothetical protein C8R45DRAFT_1095360 [Mycena sanguinolenta]